MYPTAGPSEAEIMYNRDPFHLTCRLGREIVTSMPSLSTSGGIFLLYPAMRAAKIMSREDKLFIVSMLRKVAFDVPVAAKLAEHVLEFEFKPPTPEQCRTQLAKVWDIQGNYVGNEI